MPKFHTVKAGDILYDVHRERMGNTTMSRLGCWTVEVIDIDHEEGRATVRWNGNRPQTYFVRQIERLRRSIPKKISERRGLI